MKTYPALILLVLMFTSMFVAISAVKRVNAVTGFPIMNIDIYGNDVLTSNSLKKGGYGIVYIEVGLSDPNDFTGYVLVRLPKYLEPTWVTSGGKVVAYLDINSVTWAGLESYEHSELQEITVSTDQYGGRWFVLSLESSKGSTPTGSEYACCAAISIGVKFTEVFQQDEIDAYVIPYKPKSIEDARNGVAMSYIDWGVEQLVSGSLEQYTIEESIYPYSILLNVDLLAQAYGRITGEIAQFKKLNVVVLNSADWEGAHSSGTAVKSTPSSTLFYTQWIVPSKFSDLQNYFADFSADIAGPNTFRNGDTLTVTISGQITVKYANQRIYCKLFLPSGFELASGESLIKTKDIDYEGGVGPPPLPLEMAYSISWTLIARSDGSRGSYAINAKVVLTTPLDPTILPFDPLQTYVPISWTKWISTPPDFQISATASKGVYNQGNRAAVSITFLSNRVVTTGFWPTVHFKDSVGGSSKYDPQIVIPSGSIILDPYQQKNIDVTFEIPAGSPSGQFEISVDCWTDNTYSNRYADDLFWSSVFTLVENPPVPAMTSVKYPATVNAGAAVDIDVFVKNEGGAAAWQTIAISFPPSQPMPSSITVTQTDLETNNIYAKGESAGAAYSTKTVTLQTYLVEGYTPSWQSGGTHHLEISVTPSASGKFTFYVKSVAASFDTASNWDPNISKSLTMDQQEEYVYAYTVSVGRVGGPDNFGYSFKDSNAPRGPTYDWKEISADASATEILPNSDDTWVSNIGLGFFFSYYGTDYSRIAIGNNGILFSGTGTSQYINQPITQTPGIHGFLAPYWDDLVTWGSAGSVYYETLGTAPNRMFVAEWYNNGHYHDSSAGVTFEAVLYEGTNNILFQYEHVTFGSVSGAVPGDNPPYDYGGSATVGIEDPTGNIGLQYSYNEQVIYPGLAILFEFPAFAGTNLHLSMNAPASMDHGNTMTYSLYYNDFGDAAASNVVLQATLSSNVDFVSASDGGTYDSATGNVTWNVGMVPAFPSGRGLRTVTVTIPSSVPVGTMIQTAASIRTTTLETRYDDNVASVQTKVTGSNLPPNVGVDPTVDNSGGTPVINWGTAVTFRYYNAMAASVDIRIQMNDGGPDITGSMIGGPPAWTFTVTFYPRHGYATVTYTVHYPVGPPPPPPVSFGVYVDPAGYIYDTSTLQRISGATVWLQRPDGQGGWEDVPTGQTPPIMQPDVNPQITGANGQYQWDVLEGSYRVHVEAPGFYPADSIIVNVPPPVTDLHIGLTPLPVSQYQITVSQTGVGNDLTGTIVIIDGTDYTASDLPAVFSWDQGSVHNFSFASSLNVNSGKEYVWTGTTGLFSVQSGSINITTDGTIVGNYQTQYYLTVQTSPTGVNSPAGEGWYDVGSSAPISTEQYVDIASPRRYHFTGWITSNMAELTNSSAPSTAILIDEAKTVAANYVTQYSITFDQTGVGSDFTNTVVTIDGTGYGVGTLPASFWLDNSSTHTFTFPSPLSVGSGAKEYDWASSTGLSTLQLDSITVTGAGNVTGNYVTHVHDVAVTSVLPVVPHCSSKVGNDSWVFQGRPVYVNVTISNKGNFDENVTITLYYNSTPSNSAKGINSPNILLSANQTLTIILLWNTTAIPYCLNYTITAVATIPLDDNPADNTLDCGPITVRIMGDINGDGKVDGKDIVAVAMSFPSWGPDFLCPGSPPGPRWNLDCDINCDNRIDGKDLVLTALNFGK